MIAQRPLAGTRIVVTRARAQARSLAQKIVSLGGEVIELPTIEIEAARDVSALDAALARLDDYQWVIFTSVNSVDPFLSRLAHVGQSVTRLARLNVAAIGSETAKRLEGAGIAVSVIPRRYQAEGLLESLGAGPMRGQNVLIPRAAKARDVLPETLRQWGAKVDVVEAYRTVVPAIDASGIKKRFWLGEIDIVTFTSSSTVSNFVQLMGGTELAPMVGNAVIACIGPITAKTVENLGGQVVIMAREFTIDGLVDAIVEYRSASGRTAHAETQRAPSSKK